MEDDDPYDPYWDYDEDWPVCPTCNGQGTINPLTAPSGYLCLGTEACPSCEGSGDAP